MGKQLFDQYTLLHFCVGVVIYFWGIKLSTWMILHVIFEFIENTDLGMNFINTFLSFWPGGKYQSDMSMNKLGDNVGAFAGWLCAYYLDNLGDKLGWYKKHIKIKIKNK